MRVYSEGVKNIIHYGPSKSIEAYRYKNDREGCNTPDHVDV